MYHPYGLAGGGDASCGVNYWVRRVRKRGLPSRQGEDDDNKKGQKEEEDEYELRTINLGGKNTAAMAPGERIVICTPGGGGWGPVGKESAVDGKGKRDEREGWRKGSLAARMEAQETV